MQCNICEEEIIKDSQYINGKYYHNICIENLSKENQQLKEQLKQKEAIINKIREIFEDCNNSFSDGCDCRKIEKLLESGDK